MPLLTQSSHTETASHPDFTEELVCQQAAEAASSHWPNLQPTSVSPTQGQGLRLQLVPDLDVSSPGAGAEDRRQHRVVGGAETGLRVPLQCTCPAGSAEAEHQDPAVSAACHQQITTWGALTANRIAFHLWRKRQSRLPERL